MKKGILVLIAVLAVAVAVFYVFNDTEEPILRKQDKVSKEVVAAAKKPVKIDKKVLRISDFELALGRKNAPVEVVEYASLSCPHCAAFYNEAFEEFKDDFIDKGKVRFVYRDFPLNQPALAAAMVAVCRTYDEDDRVETYYDFLEKLFKMQDVWAFDPQFIKKIENIAVLDGMAQEDVLACVNDQKLQKKILKARLIASKSLMIASTPTFFVNGKRLEGYVDYGVLKKAVKAALKGEGR